MTSRRRAFALLGCPRVFRGLTIGSNSTDIANANRVRILTRAMRADFSDRASNSDGSIAVHYIMIADAFEASLTMPTVDISHCKVFSFGSG